MRFATLLCVLSVASSAAVAQRPSETARGGSSKTVQPKIMVIPFTKEGQDIRTVLESDFNTRIALSKVKEGFDKRGFSTVEFRQVLSSLASDQAIQGASQSDIKSRIIEQSRCDIYVEVEMHAIHEGANDRVSMISNAFLAANGSSLANKNTNTAPFHGVPIEMIVDKAAGDKLDDFLATMQEKFNGFIEGGVPIRVEFSVAQGAKPLSRTVGDKGDELGDAIEEWLQKNAYRNNYHISGRTPIRMTVDEVRIPMFDPVTNNNFNPSQFSLELVRYLRSLGVKASRSMTNGVIYVEIQ
jgi:hypothetical protein